MTKKKKVPTTHKFRYFRCTGAALDLLKAYQAELELLSVNHMKLHAELQERTEVLYCHHQGNLKSMWARLSALVGLDPKKTWGNPEYQIEARYLDDGFGAILYLPQSHGNTLQELLGGVAGQPEDDPFGEEAPDKSRLN